MVELCRRCEKVKPLSEFYADKRAKTGHQSTCKRCMIEKALAWQAAHPEQTRKTARAVHERRQEKFHANPELVEARNAQRREKYASDPEYREYRLEAIRKYNALKAAAKVDDIVDAEVFERDGWICGICREPVDPALKYPARFCATVDHIIPFTRGGLDSWDNVQCAHFTCNVSKYNKLPDEYGAPIAA